MTKKVAKKQTTEIEKVTFKHMGASDRIDQQDIITPKIHLMQQMSDLVKEQKARSGEFRNSLTGDLMGNTTSAPVELFVFLKYKLWYERDLHTKKYIRSLDWYANQHLDYQGKDKEGVEVSRDLVLGYFSLLADHVLDTKPRTMPIICEFTRTSYEAGKNIETICANMKMDKMPSYATSFIITAEEQSFTDGDCFVKKTKQGRMITQDECNIVERWITTFEKNQRLGMVKIDNSDLKEEIELKPDVIDTSSPPVNY